MSSYVVKARRWLIQQGAEPLDQTRTVRTDDHGRFRISGLSPGAYYVLASIAERVDTSASGSASQGNLPTYFPGTTAIEKARAISVSLAHDAVADFVITPVRLLAISGRVVDSRGRRLSGGTVKVVRLTETNVLVPLAVGAGRIQPDGSFRLKVPAEGAYVLYASSGNPWRAPGIQNDIEVGRTSVNVRAQELTDVLISTVPGGIISGRLNVAAAAPKDAVAPQRVAAVTLDPENAAAEVLISTAVKPDGTFELRNVFGHVVLDVGPPGPAGWLKAVVVNGKDVSDAGIDVGPAKHVQDVQIVLGDPATEVFGVATAARGQPARNSVVLLFAAEEAKWRQPLTRHVRATRASEDGHYAIGGLPPADYFAIALEHIQIESATEPTVLARLRSMATRVRFHDGERKNLNLSVSARAIKQH
jgi:hypothetical protein